VESTEEEVRRYLGGLDDLRNAVGMIEYMSASYSDLLSLRAILLDRCMRDKGIYKDKIIPFASKIIELYSPYNDGDTRYLLSRYLHPYAVLAKGHEAKGDWKDAIDIFGKTMR
jgi:hypothetical protein